MRSLSKIALVAVVVLLFALPSVAHVGPAIYTMKLDGSDRVQVTPPVASPQGYAFVSWQPIPPNPYTGYARPKGASPFQTFLVPA
jgi:hypothetical protein